MILDNGLVDGTGGVPMYKFRTLSKNEKKHLTVTLKSKKKVKAWQYLDSLASRFKGVTRDPSMPSKQMINPVTGKPFNHLTDVKEAFYKDGVQGLNKYIEELNKALAIIYATAKQLNKELIIDMKQRKLIEDIFGEEGYKQSINQKQKGNNNERECAKWVGNWTGFPFTRVPSSGGLRWKNTANSCGDIVCEDATFNFMFSIETKHLQRVPFSNNIRSNSILLKIWEQCKRDALRGGKIPMVLVRENKMSKGVYLVCLPIKYLQLFSSDVIIFTLKEFFGVLNTNMVDYDRFEQTRDL